MITLNISPETKIGKFEEVDEKTVCLKTTSGKVKMLSKEKLKLLLEHKCTKSSNNVLYIKPDAKMGIIPSFLDRLYTSRKKYKNKEIKKSKEISKLKYESKESGKNYDDEIKKLKQLENDYNAKQMAFKLFLNSIYGQVGSKYFPMFDVDNAEAVTLTGQFVIKSAVEFIDKYFIDKYPQSKNIVEKTAIYGDTDSVYFNCENLIAKLFPEGCQFTRTQIKAITKELDVFVIDTNKFCNTLSKEKLYSPLQRIEFKRETFCTEGAFLAKKRYILHMVDDEGARVDDFKYTGVDVKKTELPEEIRDSLKHIIENSMRYNWSSKEYTDSLIELWNKFVKFKPNEIAFWRGYNTEKGIDGYLQAAKGTGIHAKAAIYYNQLLESMNIKGKYEEIRLGDRLRYAYVNRANPYRIEAIGWKEEFPKEFEDLFEFDYGKMFEKLILSPLERYANCNNWPINFNPLDIELGDLMNL